jgi:hypothetical protein
MASNVPRRDTNNGTPETAVPSNRWLAVLLAWIVPGGGHIYLGRRSRGLAFLAIFVACVWIGCSLRGQLYTVDALQGFQPLQVLATLDALAMGATYFLLSIGVGYHGLLTSHGYEYGTTFLITAGLMNVLLILDAWDLAHGRERTAPEAEEAEQP